MKVILINGRSRHGKNTISEIVSDLLYNLGCNCFELENSKTVKDFAVNYFNWNSKKDTIGKKLLINITNSGYEYNPHFWEEKSLLAVKQVKHIVDYLIVPDWRYLSTYEFWKDKVGVENVITMNVTRPNFDNKLGDAINNDKSEQSLIGFPFSYKFINNGTLQDLENSIIEQLKWDE